MGTRRNIITALMSNDEEAIHGFFFEECMPIFYYIVSSVFGYRIEKEELISELYIYLKENDWHRLRKFDSHCELKTWVGKVALNFFRKKREKLILNPSSEDMLSDNIISENMITEDAAAKPTREYDDMFLAHDAAKLLNEIKNERYRAVIQKLILEDRDPEEVAAEMNITINNLYNIKRRALQQFVQIARKEINAMKYCSNLYRCK